MNLLKKIAIYTLAGLCFLGGFEWYMRFKGYTPEPTVEQHIKDSGNFDPVLGWRNAGDCSTHPAQQDICRDAAFCKIHSLENPPDRQIYATRCSDSSRQSRSAVRKNPPYRVLLLGCSYTYGVGVEDHETYAWLLNEQFPDMTFDNFATPGYSTYQCLLLEQELLAKSHYNLVIYAAIDHHLLRNTVYSLWEDKRLANIIPPHSIINIPTNEGEDIIVSGSNILKRNEAIWYCPIVYLKRDNTLGNIPAYRRWLGDGNSALINTLKRLYIYYDTRNKVYDKHGNNAYSHLLTPYHNEIYRQLLEQMNSCAQNHGAKFAAICLDNNGKKILELDPAPSFPYAFATDGHEGELDAPKFHVAGNTSYHGSPIVHQNWANHIAEILKEWLREKKI